MVPLSVSMWTTLGWSEPASRRVGDVDKPRTEEAWHETRMMAKEALTASFSSSFFRNRFTRRQRTSTGRGHPGSPRGREPRNTIGYPAADTLFSPRRAVQRMCSGFETGYVRLGPTAKPLENNESAFLWWPRHRGCQVGGGILQSDRGSYPSGCQGESLARRKSMELHSRE